MRQAAERGALDGELAALLALRDRLTGDAARLLIMLASVEADLEWLRAAVNRQERGKAKILLFPGTRRTKRPG